MVDINQILFSKHVLYMGVSSVGKWQCHTSLVPRPFSPIFPCGEKRFGNETSATQDMAILLFTNLVSFVHQGNLTKCSHYALQTTLNSTNFRSSAATNLNCYGEYQTVMKLYKECPPPRKMDSPWAL